MPVASCPQADLIDRYLDDRLPPADINDWEAHVSSCQACESRLSRALKSDSLLPEARNGLGSTWSVPDEVRSKLLGLCGAGDTNGTVTLDTKSGANPRPAPGPVGLHPAQAPDEIGRLGEYRILKVLGEGGMGTVYPGLFRSGCLIVISRRHERVPSR